MDRAFENFRHRHGDRRAGARRPLPARTTSRGRSIAAVVAALIGVLPFSASAQSGDALFRDKTITIVVGAATGGGLDTYARLISRHFHKHIPGNPAVIVSNQPGAGGSIVARNLYATAPKDGTQIGLVFPSVLIDPLYSDAARAFDANQFKYIGNANAETPICFLHREAPVKKVEDLLSTEIVLGGTTPGSAVVDFPTVAKALLGVQWKLIPGYKATRDVLRAIESREVQGVCGIGWATIKVALPETLSGQGFGRVFVQEDNRGDPALNAAGIPLMATLAKSDLQRQVLTFLYEQNAISRPFILPPGVSDERLGALRTAFIETTRDPALQAEAKKMRIDIEPITGDAVQTIVRGMYETPAPIVQQLKAILKR